MVGITEEIKRESKDIALSEILVWKDMIQL